MKVCLLSKMYPPVMGGSGMYAYEIANGLAEIGHDVDVYTQSTGDDRTLGVHENVSVYSLAKARRYLVTFETLYFSLLARRTVDLEDYDDDARVLEFRHRPTHGTPLKNKRDGERDVGILPTVANVLEAYIDETRYDRHDEYGRAPLFTTRSSQGRLSENAVRTWSYQATHPCWHTDDPCPHDKVRDDCGWTVADQSSKCPSSRSPHAVRTGSITFHRNRGFEQADVARRVNASMRTIERHYDKATRREELETRRRPQLDKLSLTDPQEDENP